MVLDGVVGGPREGDVISFSLDPPESNTSMPGEGCYKKHSYTTVMTNKLAYPFKPLALLRSTTSTTIRISCCCCLLLLPLLMPSASSDALVVTVHTIYSLTCLSKDKFVYPVAANFAFEAMGMIRVIAGHNGFVEDGKFADVARI